MESKNVEMEILLIEDNIYDAEIIQAFGQNDNWGLAIFNTCIYYKHIRDSF